MEKTDKPVNCIKLRSGKIRKMKVNHCQIRCDKDQSQDQGGLRERGFNCFRHAAAQTDSPTGRTKKISILTPAPFDFAFSLLILLNVTNAFLFVTVLDADWSEKAGPEVPAKNRFEKLL